MHVIFLSLIPRIVFEKLLIRPTALTFYLIKKWKKQLTKQIKVYSSKDTPPSDLNEKEYKIFERILKYSFEEKAKLTLSSLFSKIDSSPKSDVPPNADSKQTKDEGKNREDNQNKAS